MHGLTDKLRYIARYLQYYLRLRDIYEANIRIKVQVLDRQTVGALITYWPI